MPEDLREYLEILQKYQDKNDELAGPYGTYLQSLHELAELLTEYGTPGPSGSCPVVDEAARQKLMEAYNRVYAGGREYLDAAAQKENEENLLREDRRELMLQLGRRLGEDIALLSGSISSDRTLPEILEQSNRMHLDITGQELGSVGANMSNRLPVSFTEDRGRQVRGFFTANTALDKERELKELARSASGGNAEWEKIFYELGRSREAGRRFSSYSDWEDNIQEALEDSDELRTAFRPLFVSCMNNGNRALTDKNVKLFDKLAKNDDFAVSFYHFSRNLARINDKYNTYERTAEIEPGAVIEERNAAMSAVADMLGLPKLLARSTKMQLTHNGKTQNGVFMQFANGYDIADTREENPLNHLTEHSMQGPALMKSLADLQMLDYICGNLDRHIGNMFYQFQNTENGPVCTGVMGIDNDLSFGKVKQLRMGGNMNLPSVNDMLAVSEKTANRLMNLSPDMLKASLASYSLKPAEIEEAVGRLTALQNRINEGRSYFREHPEAGLTRGHLRIVKEEEWSKIPPEQFSQPENPEGKKQTEADNYFTRVMNLKESIPVIRADQQKTKEKAEERENRFPQLKQKSVSSKMAQGTVLKEDNEAGIRVNRERLSALAARMKAVNQGFFISSSQFDNVIKAVKQVQLLTERMTAGMGRPEKEALRKAYLNVTARADAYLQRKNRQQAAGKTLDATSLKRIAFIRDLKEFAAERTAGLAQAIRHPSSGGEAPKQTGMQQNNGVTRENTTTKFRRNPDKREQENIKKADKEQKKAKFYK